MNEGLDDVNVSSFAIQDNFIFAGTAGKGIYRRYIPEIVGIQNPAEKLTFSITPNPANQQITLTYTPRSNSAFCEIINAYGQVIQNCNLGKNPSHTITISMLPPGIYFLKITDGLNNSSRKFIKL
jgi:hypothetical protein